MKKVLICVGVLMISLVVLCACSGGSSSSDRISRTAKYARFAQEFGEFTDEMTLKAYEMATNYGINSITLNKPQMYYTAANGIKYGDNRFDTEVKDYDKPEGYLLKINSSDINENILTDFYDEDDEKVVAYTIDDSAMDSRAYGTDGNKSFYEPSEGIEYHFITSNGETFTLPGYELVKDDGTIEYHLDSKNGHYYISSGTSNKKVGDTNINGDVITTTRAIQFSDLTEKYKELSSD